MKVRQTMTGSRLLLLLLLVALAIPQGAMAATDGAAAEAREGASASAHATQKSTKSKKKPKASKAKRGAKAKVAKAGKGKKSKKAAKKRSKRGPRFIDHVVVSGDTLGKVAFQYDVTVKDLKGWNKLRSTTIYVGDKLRVKVNGPTRQVHKEIHVVRKGETLSGIAKKYGHSVKDLVAFNRLKKKLIRPGQELVVYVEGPEVASVAVGRPQDGRLEDGWQMESGPGYFVRTPSRAWGTVDTVRTLQKVAKRLQKDSRKRSPLIVIGDLSKEGGGDLPPHKSHQNGRDVDISYIHKGELRPTKFRTANAKNLDLKHTWLLVRALLESGNVERMFIDKGIQVMLRDYVKRHASRKYRNKVDAIFQYPERGVGDPIITHEPGHKNHIHIRFKTPSDIAG